MSINFSPSSLNTEIQQADRQAWSAWTEDCEAPFQGDCILQGHAGINTRARRKRNGNGVSDSIHYSHYSYSQQFFSFTISNSQISQISNFRLVLRHFRSNGQQRNKALSNHSYGKQWDRRIYTEINGSLVLKWIGWNYCETVHCHHWDHFPLQTFSHWSLFAAYGVYSVVRFLVMSGIIRKGKTEKSPPAECRPMPNWKSICAVDFISI